MGKTQNLPSSSRYRSVGHIFLYSPLLGALHVTGCYSFCPWMETAHMPSPFCLVRQEAGPAGAPGHAWANVPA